MMDDDGSAQSPAQSPAQAAATYSGLERGGKYESSLELAGAETQTEP